MNWRYAVLNQVSLIGRMTKDPNLQVTHAGVPYVKLSLAIQRRYRNAKGEFDVDFVPCTVWRKQAESTAHYCHKGALIAVIGRIQTRNYVNEDGERVFITEIIGDDVRFLKLKYDDSTGHTKPVNPSETITST